MDKNNISPTTPCADQNRPKRRMAKPPPPTTAPSPTFRLEVVSGNDYASLEQTQAALLTASFDNLFVAAIRQGLETGALLIIDNRVVIRDKIRETKQFDKE